MLKLVTGLILIIAGLGGRMVLLGTNSSIALVVLGMAMCIWGVFSVLAASGERRRADQAKQKLGAPHPGTGRTGMRPPVRTPAEQAEQAGRADRIDPPVGD